jgi:hypothetical protein
MVQWQLAQMQVKQIKVEQQQQLVTPQVKQIKVVQHKGSSSWISSR